jgi:uncharacterized membrane protein YgcG
VRRASPPQNSSIRDAAMVPQWGGSPSRAPNYSRLRNADFELVRYKDTGCAQETNGFLQDKCSWYFVTFAIPSLMFTCDEPATDPQPTSTFTADATQIAGVATSQAGGPQSTGSGTTSTKDSTPTTNGASSSPTSGSGGDSGGSSGSAGNSGSSGLATSDKIAIGVGLGVGVPAILISLAAWLWPR